MTVGLFALGLSVTGSSARALALITPDASGGLRVPSGATRTSKRVQLNGQPTTVQVCYSPNRSPASILAHYRKIASSETVAGVPYLVEESPDGGSVVWTTVGGGRKAVIAESDPRGGTSFRLIDEPTPTKAGKVASTTLLPGGLHAPPGYTVGFCVTNPDTTGTAILESHGSPRDVLAGLLPALRSAGFAPAAQAAATQNNRLHLTFDHASGSLSGLLTASETRTGARICLTVRGQR